MAKKEILISSVASFFKNDKYGLIAATIQHYMTYENSSKYYFSITPMSDMSRKEYNEITDFLYNWPYHDDQKHYRFSTELEWLQNDLKSKLLQLGYDQIDGWKVYKYK